MYTYTHKHTQTHTHTHTHTHTQHEAEGALQSNRLLSSLHAAQRAAAEAEAECWRYKTLHDEAHAALEQVYVSNTLATH